MGCWKGRTRETLFPPHHPPGQVQAAVFPRADISSTPCRRKHTCCGSPTGSHPGSLNFLIHIMGIKERGPSDANGKSSTNGCIEEFLYFFHLGSSNKSTSVQCPSPKRRCYKKFWGAATAVGNSSVVSQKVKYRITRWPSNSTPSEVKVIQLCLTLCDPMDYRIHGILQARILKWVAFPFFRGSSQPRIWTQVSCTTGGFFTSWATGEAQEYWSG